MEHGTSSPFLPTTDAEAATLLLVSASSCGGGSDGGGGDSSSPSLPLPSASDFDVEFEPALPDGNSSNSTSLEVLRASEEGGKGESPSSPSAAPPPLLLRLRHPPAFVGRVRVFSSRPLPSSSLSPTPSPSSSPSLPSLEYAVVSRRLVVATAGVGLS
jgi:hypothetical protein